MAAINAIIAFIKVMVLNIHFVIEHTIEFIFNTRPAMFLFKLYDSAMILMFSYMRKIGLTQLFIQFATDHRTLFSLIFVIPMSFVYYYLETIRNYYVEFFLCTPELHENRIKQVQREVLRYNQFINSSSNNNNGLKMCTNRPPWQTMSSRIATYKQSCYPINVNLKDIIQVDYKRQVVLCEPLVNMGQLSRYLIPLGYSLAVMIEMEDLTVGGCLMEIGIETNSHIYGTLAETAETYEIVLGDGSFVKATRSINTDLFYMLPFSRGTLGFLVGVELKIIPCKPYMHMRYIPCHSLEKTFNEINRLCNAKNPPEFVEMTVFDKEKAVIMAGNYASVTSPEQRKKINPINYWYKPWFYKHTESYLYRKNATKDQYYITEQNMFTKKINSIKRELRNIMNYNPDSKFVKNMSNLMFEQYEDFEEYIPIRHYIHRHTKSIFWELEDILPFGNHWLYRYLLGWLGPPKISLLKLFTSTPEIRRKTVYQHVLQDMIVPLRYFKEAIELFDKEFQVCTYT